MTNDGDEQDDVPASRLCAATISRGRHRAGVEEDRDERQPHRDLVGDHLRRRPQPAEQRVGRAARPAGEHDAVDADRGDREDVQHGDRQVGELQRRLVAEDRDLRAERDDREGQERRRRGDDRRQDVDRLVGRLGMMSSLNASLMPSARLCSSPGPTRLGPIRCCIRATTRRSTQIVNSVITTRNTKTTTALTRTSHHGSSPKPLTTGDASTVPPVEPFIAAPPSPAVSRTIEPLPRSQVRCAPAHRALLVGSHTTPSGMSATHDRQRDRAAVGADRDRVAVGDADLGGGRGREPRERPSGRCRRGTARRPAAGRRRAAAPGGQHCLAGARPAPARPRRSERGWPARRPTRRARRSPPRAARTSGRPRSTSIAVGQHVQHPDVGHRVRAAQHLVERPLAALPVEEGAGLLDRGRDRQHDVGALGHRRRRAARG